jgi:hypothetical protein
VFQFQFLPGDLDLDPAEGFKPKQAQKIIGLKKSEYHEKINRGELDAPVPVSEHGRAVVHTGEQLILYHRKRLQWAAERAKARIAKQSAARSQKDN